MKVLKIWIAVSLYVAIASAGATAVAAKQQKVLLRVDGLACPFCAYGMEKKLQRVEGVEKMDIKINEGLVVLYYNEDAEVDEVLLEKKVKEAGFTPRQITIEAAEIDGEGTRNVSLDISGMDCRGCSDRVTKALSSLECVDAVTLDLSTGRADIRCSDPSADPETFVRAVEELGFDAELLERQ